MREDTKAKIDLAARKMFQDLLRYDDSRILNEVLAISEMNKRNVMSYKETDVPHFDLSHGLAYTRKVWNAFIEILKVEINDDMYAKIDLLKMAECLEYSGYNLPRSRKNVKAMVDIYQSLQYLDRRMTYEKAVNMIEIANK